MKRVLVFLLVIAAAGLLVWAGLRGRVPGSTPAAVTELLPADTLALLHLPDFLRTRDEWHRSDIYQIWREPSVQAFLEKPLSTLPKDAASRQAVADFAKLDPKDVFIALTALGDDPKTAAGFRFKGSPADVEKVIGKARAQLWAKFPAGQKAVVAYEGHQIETFVAEHFTFASVYDGAWYLAGNDVAGIKLILDRLDGRLRDAKTTLKNDETFAAALKHMSSPYAALLYAKPQALVEKLLPLLAKSGQHVSPEDLGKLRTVRSVCATTAFDGGKMHDLTFVGMPEIGGLPALSRDSVAMAPKSAFFYLTSLLNLPKEIHLPDGPADASGALASLQQFLSVLAAQGVTLEEWKSAFGPELAVVGDWRPEGRWPSLFLSLPVKDAARARKIADSMMASGSSGTWQKDEHDGVTFYSLQPTGGLFPIAPVVAVSDEILIAGLDRTAVQEAVNSQGSSAAGLASTENYRSAARAVAPPTSAFAFVDTKMLFERLDATLRPTLLMGAALFAPSLSKNVDLSKLPPTEAITKHLSPIVLSQSYQKDGYVTDSVGPVTVNEAALGIAGAIAASVVAYQQNPLSSPTPAAPAPSIPDPSATPVPDDTL